MRSVLVVRNSDATRLLRIQGAMCAGKRRASESERATAAACFAGRNPPTLTRVVRGIQTRGRLLAACGATGANTLPRADASQLFEP